MHGLDRWVSQSKNSVPIYDPRRYVNLFFKNVLQYGYFILNPPSNSETANRNGMNFEPQIEELKCPPFTKFGVKRMIGLVTVHVQSFWTFWAEAVESADRFWPNQGGWHFFGKAQLLTQNHGWGCVIAKVEPSKSSWLQLKSAENAWTL